MLKRIGNLVGGFIASEDGVRKQAILPVAWVGAVMMAAAVVLSMPEKAHASVCWARWGCENHSTYWCKGICDQECPSEITGWTCTRYGSAPKWRCKCW